MPRLMASFDGGYSRIVCGFVRWKNQADILNHQWLYVRLHLCSSSTTDHEFTVDWLGKQLAGFPSPGKKPSKMRTKLEAKKYDLAKRVASLNSELGTTCTASRATAKTSTLAWGGKQQTFAVRLSTCMYPQTAVHVLFASPFWDRDIAPT
ncbi:hypothetical protein K440DRAFT_34176 [Wilcoxina mikolae CBS 423.85]|nr:hypothetical protein K440DRAFT_34176 [Wilcoxina mikolae CBS 423.85]